MPFSYIASCLLCHLFSSFPTTSRLSILCLFHFPPLAAQTVFLFAVHVVALPISQKMQQPSDFARAAGVSFAVLTLSCALFAVFGYMLYGESTKTLILDNLVCARLLF